MKKINKLVLLTFIVHILHVAWFVILWRSIDTAGYLNATPILLLTWSIAFVFDVIRWNIVGKEVARIDDVYSYARAIELANKQILKPTWYLIAPSPSSETIANVAGELFKKNTLLQLRVVFSNYWLNRSNIDIGILAILFLCYGILSGSPPTLGGLIRSYYISIFYWYACFGLFGQMIFIFFYSLFIKFIGAR